MKRSLLLFCTPFLVGLLLVRFLEDQLPARFLVFCWMLLAVLPMAIAALKRSFDDRPPRDSAPQVSFGRLLNKSLALSAGWTLVLVGCMAGAVLDIEASHLFLDDFLPAFPILIAGIPAYILFMERLTGIAEDDYSHAGLRLRGHGLSSWKDHRRLLMSWSVKAFFIPLMYGWLHIALMQLLNMGSFSLSNWTVWLFSLGLSLDLLVATAGYVFASKLFQSDVISVDDTWTGWLVCLVCYPPLLQHLHILTAQVDHYIWTDWLDPSQALYWVWAGLIVTSWMIYWLSTIAFGLRFSNLSYRGLVDSGPYRWCKHPAYLSKNIYWWIHTVPFFGVLSAGELLRNVLGLSLLSLVYFLRAKTEERHLSRFPEYVAYMHRVDSRALSSLFHRKAKISQSIEQESASG